MEVLKGREDKVSHKRFKDNGGYMLHIKIV